MTKSIPVAQTKEIGSILTAVASAFQLTRKELLSNSRLARISIPRHLVMYIMVKHYCYSKVAAGALFDSTDQGARYALESIPNLIECGPREIRHRIDAVFQSLNLTHANQA